MWTGFSVYDYEYSCAVFLDLNTCFVFLFLLMQVLVVCASQVESSVKGIYFKFFI